MRDLNLNNSLLKANLIYLNDKVEELEDFTKATMALNINDASRNLKYAIGVLDALSIPDIELNDIECNFIGYEDISTLEKVVEVNRNIISITSLLINYKDVWHIQTIINYLINVRTLLTEVRNSLIMKQ